METVRESCFGLDNYVYELPEGLVAQTPPDQRGASRMLAMERFGEQLHVSTFAQLDSFIPPKSLIVVNNSRVVPGRLHGTTAHGARVEMLVLTPVRLLEESTFRTNHGLRAKAECLVRPGRKIHEGDRLNFDEVQAHILEKLDFGRCRVELSWQGEALSAILQKKGEIPLPPYIKRKADQRDVERYQTVYASDMESGSIAAPTAGLHFTPAMRQQLIEAGHDWADVTLYVGYGTFSPIRDEDIRKHRMHAEYVKISEGAARRIERAAHDGQPIIAVGTTVMRTLEGVYEGQGKIRPFSGWVDSYIYPGYSFKIVQGLVTNFHLPRSSLLVLVSAFAGREQILAAYRRAVAEDFKFFSYGDCMYIGPIRNDSREQIAPGSEGK
jgi:S-adenosylmethionine:tRNA ribosyltransferase-isomerase